LRASPISGINVQWQADYDHRTHALIDNAITVDYRHSKYYVSVGENAVHFNLSAATPTNPILAANANQLHFRGGFGDFTHRGLSAGFEAIYDYRQGSLNYTTSQITYNTNCCGFSFQLHSINLGSRVETVPRFAFTIANIATPFGNLKKSDRIF
jgi:LPS-assembly protein